VLAVGRVGPLLREAVGEYERRASRYWSFEAIETREEKASQGLPADRIRAAEAERLLARVPPGFDIVALTRAGAPWDSTRLARYLEQLGVQSRAGAAFLIGGALGLGDEALQRATHQLRLSDLTLPHELARLTLTEQLYRAGTIVRGEPYHKARE